MRRRTLLKTTSGGGVDPSKSAPCDLCFYDRTTDSLIIVAGYAWNRLTYPSSRYVPIGVVVVPGSHNVYGDSSCGVMSMKAMNCDSPDSGSTSNQYMYWGVQGTDISSLPNLNQAPIVGTISSPGNSSGTITGQTNYPYMPSDWFNGKQCPHDTNARYYGAYPSSSVAPSPYLSDGSRNPGYYQTTSPSSTSNCLADFDGRGNTDKIITQRGAKDYSSWAPGRTTAADYPAVSCCDMFYTEGTSQGDWYLPAMGELGYMMARLGAINEAISKMVTAYGTSYGVAAGNSAYWSSSEDSSVAARLVYMNSGYVANYNKSSDYYVRAFLRVGGSE